MTNSADSIVVFKLHQINGLSFPYKSNIDHFKDSIHKKNLKMAPNAPDIKSNKDNLGPLMGEAEIIPVKIDKEDFKIIKKAKFKESINRITNISGINYLYAIGGAIISTALLLHKGKNALWSLSLPFIMFTTPNILDLFFKYTPTQILQNKRQERIKDIQNTEEKYNNKNTLLDELFINRAQALEAHKDLINHAKKVTK